MSSIHPDCDALVIGGGFFGSVIAAYLAGERGLKVTLIEREAALLTRASYRNQARVHNGYHYPRSYTTAFRSRLNLRRFVHDWSEAIRSDFTKIYAIARRNSKVTAIQFKRFCAEIGAPIRRADPALRSLFNAHLIEDLFEVEECAFDARRLADLAERELSEKEVKVLLGCRATKVTRVGDINQVLVDSGKDLRETITCRYLFNCTYSALNQLAGDLDPLNTTLKHEIAEIALVDAPPVLEGLGITVMDGPFFSMMPFPPRELHSLSHVRYTPHLSWLDTPAINPDQKLQSYDCKTRIERMLRDAARYLPSIAEACYIESLFEIKTVLVNNDVDDGRPILIERQLGPPWCYSILGGKIDNIFDVIEQLEHERF